MVFKKKLTICLLTATLVVQTSCRSYKKKEETKLATSKTYPDKIVFIAPKQNPEGIEYNPQNKLFYLSAINPQPSIITVNLDGCVEKFSNDKDSISRASFGLQIDFKNNRLLACTNGLKRGNVHIYNLNNGELEHVVNLSSLLPKKEHYQINDLIVDNDNSIFVTGRLEDAIYKIDEDLQPSVFFQKTGYTKPNGIAYHSDGYLLVSYSNEHSCLVKIPINNPEAAEKVTIKDYDFKGFDGMLLNKKDHLVGITFASDSNGDNFVLELKSNDNWKTASVSNAKKTKKSTTIAQVKPNLYYVLNQDWKNRNAENWALEKVEFD